jgi:hypothetical protein
VPDRANYYILADRAFVTVLTAPLITDITYLKQRLVNPG